MRDATYPEPGEECGAIMTKTKATHRRKTINKAPQRRKTKAVNNANQWPRNPRSRCKTKTKRDLEFNELRSPSEIRNSTSPRFQATAAEPGSGTASATGDGYARTAGCRSAAEQENEAATGRSSNSDNANEEDGEYGRPR